MELKPYDSVDSPAGAYVLLYPAKNRRGRQVVALGRDYGFLGFLSPHQAARLIRAAGGPISRWKNYTGGGRPDGWLPGEPVDGVWIDANKLSGLAINITTDRRAA